MSSHRRLIAGIAVVLATPGITAPTLDPLISDHAVLQRGQPIFVSGTAAPGERIELALAGSRGRIKADAQGRWAVQLPPMAAGGPHRLEARAGSGVAVAKDLLVGDVWLCSGQSNMEYPVRRSLNSDAEVAGAGDPQLRLATVPQRASLVPQPFAPASIKWAPAAPESAAEFSAACYFMGRDLRAAQQVPVGLIDATWGGTAIRGWMDEDAARASGARVEADLLALYRRDPAAAGRSFGEHWGRWWRAQNGDTPGAEPWRDSSRLRWRDLPAFTYWEQWGDPEFAAFNGAVWARRRVRLSASEAAGAATISLGVIDDIDMTFINGVSVGTTFSWSDPRNYRIPAGLLRPGDNEILVYVRDNWSFGGFQGPADRIKLTVADGTAKPLGTGWQISMIAPSVGEPPLAPWDGQSGVATLFNGMIAPLGRVGLTGVAWYQGESDVGKAGYDRRLTAMIAGWRRQFAAPRLPFLVVGLARWGKPTSRPQASQLASLLNEQRLAAERDPSTALVPALDLGEQVELHPPNKQEVGRRLALAAQAYAYQSADAERGPLPLAARRTADGIRVDFSGPLRTLSGAGVLAFELCGQDQQSCRFADARVVELTSVVLPNDGRAATRVRYAWADYPIVNLYSGTLPVPTFELPIR